MSRVGIGIPVYQSFSPQVAFDYMRMWYSFGRRYPEHDFFLLTRIKSEQFRARNAIVETALRFSMDYLLFLDDDHIFNWMETPEHTPYEFLRTLLDHKKDIVGCLYYHRTGEYKPVLMTEFEEGKYRFLTDAEINGGLQQVDVQGGGCMLIDMKIFNKILPPYFEPEQQTDGQNLGTDIQICQKARRAGFEVWCDTSIVVGHIKQENEIVTGLNRDSFIADNILRKGTSEEWIVENWAKDLRADVRQYMGLQSDNEINEWAMLYNDMNWPRFGEFKNKVHEYYKSLGDEQVCRQTWYHSKKQVAWEDLMIIKQFKKGVRAYGLDFGCGISPVGFELIKLGHSIDFVDIDGAGAYEFLKWRVEKSEFPERAGWQVEGPYDFVLMLDIIEHLPKWEKTLDNIVGRIKEKGILITNYFYNRNYKNPEHISMNHQPVMDFLLSRNMIPRSNSLWQKDDNYMGAMNMENAA